MSRIKIRRRRIAVIGLPMLQSVDNLSSVAIANYSEKRGDWQFVLATEATVEAIRFLQTVDCDGAIVRLLSPAMRREAQKIRVPLINVSSWLENPGVPTIRHDYRSCGHLAATYLLDKGYRRFGCVMTPGGCIPRRSEPFLDTIRAQGFKPSIFELRQPRPFLRRPLETSERNRFIAWIRALNPPAALVLMDDWDAPALMRTCNQIGLQIPRDIAVLSIGIHNETLAACPVSLTAVQEDHETQMMRVVEYLERMMSGKRLERQIYEVPPLGIIERASTATSAIYDPVIARAVDYIKGRLTANIHISRMAEALNVSRATLDRRFLEQTGETPHDFLTGERIKLAQEHLLADPMATLEDIAGLCGLGQRRRLNLVFKRATGLLPREWRARASNT